MFLLTVVSAVLPADGGDGLGGRGLENSNSNKIAFPTIFFSR